MDKVAVLIPCYNEEKTIEKVEYSGLRDTSVRTFGNRHTGR